MLCEVILALACFWVPAYLILGGNDAMVTSNQNDFQNTWPIEGRVHRINGSE